MALEKWPMQTMVMLVSNQVIFLCIVDEKKLKKSRKLEGVAELINLIKADGLWVDP
jgi:hypothetical protein